MRWWMYVLLLVLATAALVLPRKLARKSKLLDRARPAGDELLRKQMEDLLIQLQEFAREVNATLDTKMIALNQLIEQSEGRIRELNDLLARVQEARTNSSPAGLPHDAGNPSQPAERKLSQADQAVLRLADEGKTDIEIARQTGMSRGEIDLVLALHRKTSGR